jgi:hypothetical protein
MKYMYCSFKLQKVIRKKIYFCGILKVTDENSGSASVSQRWGSGSSSVPNVTDWQSPYPDPLVRGADPDLYQNVTDWQGPDPDPLVRGADPDPDPSQNVTDWQGADSREHEGAA